MKFRAAVAVGLVAAVIGVPISGSTVKGGCSGSSSSSSQHGPKNDDKYKEWCKEVVPGDNSTYVYYYTNHKGDSGYVRGRKHIEPYIPDPHYSTKRVC